MALYRRNAIRRRAGRYRQVGSFRGRPYMRKTSVRRTSGRRRKGSSRKARVGRSRVRLGGVRSAPGSPNVSLSMMKVTHKSFKLPKFIKNLTAPYFLRYNVGGRVQAGNGSQGVADIPFWVSADDPFKTSLGTITGASLNNDGVISDAFVAFKAVQPQFSLTEVNETVRILWMGTKGVTEVFNKSNSSVNCRLYWCFSRRDKTLDAGFNNPTLAFGGGLDAQDGPLSDGASPIGGAFPGSTPFESGKFTSQWRVTSVKKFTLPPGGRHLAYFHQKGRRLLNEAFWGDYNIARNFSLFPFIVTEGMPVALDATGTDPGSSTLSQHRVHWITRIGHQFRAIGQQKIWYDTATNFGPAPYTQTTPAQLMTQDYNIIAPPI